MCVQLSAVQKTKKSVPKKKMRTAIPKHRSWHSLNPRFVQLHKGLECVFGDAIRGTYDTQTPEMPHRPAKKVTMVRNVAEADGYTAIILWADEQIGVLYQYYAIFSWDSNRTGTASCIPQGPPWHRNLNCRRMVPHFHDKTPAHALLAYFRIGLQAIVEQKAKATTEILLNIQQHPVPQTK